MDFKALLEKIAAGDEVSKTKASEAASAALAKIDSGAATNARLREQAKAAGAQLGEEMATAGVFGGLELARGYRGDKGLKVLGRDPTMVIGIGTQMVGLGAKVMGKKWGRWVNGVGRGFTLSGFGAVMRSAGQGMSEAMKKRASESSDAPPAPVQGRRTPALPHPTPEVIVSPARRREPHLKPLNEIPRAPR